MSVGTFDPSQLNTSGENQTISASLLAAALDCARRYEPAASSLALDDADVSALCPLLTHPAWADAAQHLTTADIVALIRLFTVGDRQYSAWKAGAKSPVVALVRRLKKSGEMTPDLTAWIKQNTDNRYLPHGDLMDRLKP